MSQHDLDIANAGGAAVRADLNNALKALGSLQSGSSAPGTTYAYMYWADTNTGYLKQRNSANNGWTTIQPLDASIIASAAGNDAYVVALTPAITSYVDGMTYKFKSDVANTGAASLNINGVGIKNIKKISGATFVDLNNNDIVANQICIVVWNSTADAFILLSQSAVTAIGIGGIYQTTYNYASAAAVATDLGYGTWTLSSSEVLIENFFLAHMEGTTVEDNSGTGMINQVTVVGTPVLTTDQYKFNTKSLHTGYTTGWPYFAAGYQVWSDVWAWGFKDFTVDFWLRPDANYGFMFDWFFGLGGYGLSLEALNTDNLRLTINGHSTSASYTLVPNTWTHFAVVRASGTIKVFAGGTQVGTDISGNYYLRNASNYWFSIGGRGDGNDYMNGYFDEFRVAPRAVWTANFTPPTSAYSANPTLYQWKRTA